MTPERAQEIERLYHEACGHGPSERSAFLEHACAGDDPLRVEVESLLACRDKAAGFLEAPVPDVYESEDARNESLTATASTSGTDRPGFFRRQPWWVWCCSLSLIVAAASACFHVLAAPQPAGWKLKSVKDHGRAVAYRVIAVAGETPAERAGFEVADLISIDDVERFAREQQPGVAYQFDLVHAGRPQTRTLTLGRNDWSYWRGREGLRRVAVAVASMAHLALAGILLFSRPRDRAARWGALLFAQIGLYMASTVVPARFAPETAYVLRALPIPLGVLIGLAWSVSATIPAGAFGFCAVFPRPIPLTNQRWWPWWLILVALLATTGIDLEFVWLPVYAPGAPDVPRFVLAAEMPLGVIFVAWALALLARSFRRIENPSERRRLRLVVAGFGVTGSTLAVDILLMSPWARIERVRLTPYWQFAWVFLLSAAAVCLAYAILRHRVFDIQVIVRLGLRYAAARGVLLSILPAAALVLAFDVFIHKNQPVRDIAADRGLLYLALGAGALVLHLKRKSWMDELDRRFFRERYDAYRLLGGVADDVRRSASFDEAARQVIARIDDALHPESASLMVCKPGDPAYRSQAAINDAPPLIPAGARLVDLARVLNKPLENSQGGTGWLQQQLPRAEAALLRRARVEWLFPVSLRETGTQAFLLLGPKRSEEPYSREDRQLLEAVTASLGLLLDRPPPPGFTECSTCGACYDLGVVHCANDDGTLVKCPYPRTIAGRYRFDRRLGRGGMGVVYAAFDAELKRQVAVKVIRPDLVASPDAVARFRREARTAAHLSHPSVVNVYDFGVAEDDRAYLVMELLKGRGLREELSERGRLDSETALDVLRAVSGAVALAHENGLLHRDIKPENIFLAQSEHGRVAKILDFGLAKPLNPGATDTVARTIPGALIGTPAYMSPEQLRGEAPAETWDVWALAVVAFEMLTGTHPFACSVGTRGGLVGGGSPVPCVDGSTLTPTTRIFFERAFAVDCSRRPLSVRQFIDEFAAALQVSAGSGAASEGTA
jgi:hypothetical protein